MDQGVDFDSKKAPGQLRLRLLEENPKWKLPERRVARYLKKHLKARKNPRAEEIDADIDEETAYSTLSKQTTSTNYSAIVPSLIVCIQEDDFQNARIVKEEEICIQEDDDSVEVILKDQIVKHDVVEEICVQEDDNPKELITKERIIEHDVVGDISEKVESIEEENNQLEAKESLKNTEKREVDVITKCDVKGNDNHEFYADENDREKISEKNCFELFAVLRRLF